MERQRILSPGAGAAAPSLSLNVQARGISPVPGEDAVRDPRPGQTAECRDAARAGVATEIGLSVATVCRLAFSSA